MGCGNSSSGGGRPTGGAKLGGVVLPQEPPYAGQPVTYNFVNLDISAESKTGFAFSPGIEFQTLAENIYLPALADLYNFDYKMLSFVVTPGSMTASGFVSLNLKTTMKVQGIFRRITNEERGKWKLVLEKSCLPKAVFKYGLFNICTASQPDHIFQTIMKMANDGGRLVAIEVTGGSFAEGLQKTTTTGFGNTQMNLNLFGHNPNSLLGVDLFFDMPTSAKEETYHYQCVPLKLTSVWSPLTGKIGGSFDVHFDWQNCVYQYVSTGWRLVEVFLDQNTQSAADRTFMASKVTTEVGAMFVFEKPTSKMNDQSAVYEVKMVEYRAPGKMKMAGIGKTEVTVLAAWEGMLQANGNNGWEVVRILQTPATPFKNTISLSPEFEWIHYVFFQRLIIATPVQEEKNDTPPEATPPEVVQVSQ